MGHPTPHGWIYLSCASSALICQTGDRQAHTSRSIIAIEQLYQYELIDQEGGWSFIFTSDNCYNLALDLGVVRQHLHLISTLFTKVD